MSNIAVEIENLAKVYRIGVKEEQADTLARALVGMVTAPIRNYRRLRKLSHLDDRDYAEDVIWALRNISMTVERGEVVGIIGHNGAGKSTLLKILSRITAPTEGRVTLHGRVGSLLEVGTGFHGDLTGRENIYMNGAILGMKKREIDRKLDDIIDFAGTGTFVDTPVKRYSSGMTMRLAFAVAAHLEPEILVVDEVLAVGDHAFQQQCLGKMGEIAKAGRTVLFVSHNLAAVSSLCSRAVLLENGQSVAQGGVNDVIQRYLTRDTAAGRVSLVEREDRQGTGDLLFTSLAFRASDGTLLDQVPAGADIEVVVGYEMRPDAIARRAIFKLGLRDLFQRPLATCLSRTSHTEPLALPARGRIVCRIPRLPLVPGRYPFDLWCKLDEAVADWLRPAAAIEVVSGDFFGTGRLPPRDGGDILLDHCWYAETETGKRIDTEAP
jgi:lipopolysaccharide transport system ATP-binding protein